MNKFLLLKIIIIAVFILALFSIGHTRWKIWSDSISEKQEVKKQTAKEYSDDTSSQENIHAEELPQTVVDTSDWKTYRNEEYGFEVKYPPQWYAKISTSSIRFYDKNWYFSFTSTEERERAEASVFTWPIIHLYNVSPERYSNWIDQAHAIRNRIGGDESSDGWYAAYFRYQGIKKISGISFNVFTWVGVDGYGELMTYHPNKKLLFGIEAQVRSGPVTISNNNVREMVESIRFLSPQTNMEE